MRNNQSGFTLSELLIVLGIITLVTGAVFTLTYQGQRTFQSEAQLNETTRQARLAMDQIVRYLRQAGNAPLGPLGVPAIELLGGNSLRINSDITGTVPSSTTDPLERTGDPNGLLDSIHEMVVVAYDRDSQRIVMDIGYGPVMVAANVSALNFTFYDLAGIETFNPGQIVRAEVEMVTETDEPTLSSGHIGTVTFESNVFLRSKAFNLFPAP